MWIDWEWSFLFLFMAVFDDNLREHRASSYMSSTIESENSDAKNRLGAFVLLVFGTSVKWISLLIWQIQDGFPEKRLL